MASHNFVPCIEFLLLATMLCRVLAFTDMSTLNCTLIDRCDAYLYHINSGIPVDQLASLYSVNSSSFKPISRFNGEDYLITVPCSCNTVNGPRGYFYDTSYPVNSGETFQNVSNLIYSNQAWRAGDEETNFIAGQNYTMHLLCGCVESKSQTIVTYTVQRHDTLSDIAILLSAYVDGIQNLNSILHHSTSGFIDVGWVLFVPMEINGIPPPSFQKREAGSGKRRRWTIVVAILSTMTLLLLAALLVIIVMRKRSQKKKGDPRAISKSMSARACSMQDGTTFDSERPKIVTVEEIEDATNNFDETRKLGEGGYGSVYFGLLDKKEVAIKKMRSNKSKEFFAELKVLCKIHHINVVELLGYASGDDYLYLVYEYVPYGSLSDHLHDPLLKGYQPLSWTARAQIALDAAKGIEYIHDHTKSRYVHRDIKSSNILLGHGLRAKVADFGLAKLVERTDGEELIVTRLVGTPGYLPPELVKELQVTMKTDVFAFGVVLAELITGQRALARANGDPSKMTSLITVVYKIFESGDPQSALELVVDKNLKDNYPMDDVYKMAEVADWCMSEEAGSRPEMRDVIPILSQIATSSVEWEASLRGNQVFSGELSGR